MCRDRPTIIGKKEKYIYYSCNNSKGICSKKWIREEKLLEQRLIYFDKIRLPDSLIDEIVAYLKKSFATEQEFFKNSQDALRKELDQIQKRLSKLIDMHINGDENCLITAKTVLDLAKHAKEIFMSSNLKEKQQLLNFVFSNLKLDEKKLSVTLREPFSTILAVSHLPANLRMLDSNQRPMD